MSSKMDAWIDGWIEKWMDGWVDEWMDLRWVDGSMLDFVPALCEKHISCHELSDLCLRAYGLEPKAKQKL